MRHTFNWNLNRISSFCGQFSVELTFYFLNINQEWTRWCIIIFLHFVNNNSGTARGCGWQKIGAFVNLGSYYLVGIPSAVVLAFVLHIGGKVNRSSSFCTITLILMCDDQFYIAIAWSLFSILIASCRDSGWGSFVH